VNQFYTLVALDIANDRAREARDHRHAAAARASQPARPSIARRGLALGLAAVSRGSAHAARRLDSVVADDLGRSLTPTK
jgi:hypothetical protein